MKKAIAASFIALLMAFCILPCISLYSLGSPSSEEINISIDGRKLEFDAPPVSSSGRILVPMRAIFEALGAQVAWDEVTSTATAKKDKTVIRLQIDSSSAEINEKGTQLDVPATIINSRTYVPARFVSEAMGAKVEWNESSRTVIITTALSKSVVGKIPIIDAHSQIDETVPINKAMELVEKGGISRIILNARGKLDSRDILNFSSRYPEKIIPSIATKGKDYDNNTSQYYSLLKEFGAMKQFGGIGEVLLYHREKESRGAPLREVYTDDKRVTSALDIALQRNWPLLLHIEFKAAGRLRDSFMKSLEEILDLHPDQPFVMMHMGQLESGEVRSLIEKHKNIYFMTSHSNTISISVTNQPWVNMFDGEKLSPRWKSLITAYPDRFVMGFDNVYGDQWSDLYIQQINLWRSAMDDLPADAAHALAHGNAERLWNIEKTLIQD